MQQCECVCLLLRRDLQLLTISQALCFFLYRLQNDATSMQNTRNVLVCEVSGHNGRGCRQLKRASLVFEHPHGSERVHQHTKHMLPNASRVECFLPCFPTHQSSLNKLKAQRLAQRSTYIGWNLRLKSKCTTPRDKMQQSLRRFLLPSRDAFIPWFCCIYVVHHRS